MKKVLNLVVWIGLAMPVLSQKNSKVVLDPERPGQGESVRIGYVPAGGPGAGPVSMLAYVYDTMYRWHAYELPMVVSGDSGWKADWKLPGAAGMVAFAFRGGDTVDNLQDNGSYIMVGSDRAMFQAGAEAGYGLLRSPAYGLGVPDYYKNFSVSDTATYMWLSNEIIRHQTAALKLVMPYTRAKLAYEGPSGRKDVARAVGFLLKLTGPAISLLPNDGGGEEEPLVKAYLICRDYLRDSVRADSLRTVVLGRWPSGALARSEAYQRAMKAASTADRLALASAFVRDYPYSDGQFFMDRLLGIEYGRVYRNLVAISVAEQHSDVILKFGPLPFMNIPEAYYKAVEIPYDDWKTMNAATAFPLSDALYKMLLGYSEHRPAAFWYYSDAQWREYYEKTCSGYFRIHARILMELGKDARALALARRAQAVYHYTFADLDQTEAILLGRLGQVAAQDSLLRVCVRLNQVTPVMMGMLKASYEKGHGGVTGFDAWIESMKDAHTRELVRSEILHSKLDMEAPGFVLKDASGRTVDLRLLRGKVVVLDFWATWCAPCKAAMAGMNMAAERFSADTNVVFLFIDTQERDPKYREKGAAFLKEKGYGFRVLYDQGESMDRLYKAYSTAIHTSGIPFKAIIDGKGRLRFANIGFKGSPSGLADEIGMMIEMARGGDVTSVTKTAATSVTKTAATSMKTEKIFYGHDSIRLGATLTYPADGRARSAIVLVSGTGKQDRDGMMAGHAMFALIADSLTRRGFAVLRSDDRGVGESNGIYDSATTADFAEDVLSAVEYLHKWRPGLRIGLLGHSEGGMAAAIAASRDTGIAFVISLSSMGKRGVDALLSQNKQLVADANIPAVNKLRYDSANGVMLRVAYQDRDRPDLEQRLRDAYARWKVWDDSVVNVNKLAYGGHFFFPLESYIRQACGRWYRYFIGYDPAVVLSRVHVPYLAINGDRDHISEGVVNLRGIADALAAGENRHVTVWLAPGLNHLYQHCKTCAVDEYALLPETMAPEVLTRIGDWINGI